MQGLLTTFHFILCFFLIVTILLQAGKGADIGAAFGAGGSQTLFGPRGAATFLSKLTTVVALLFLLTSVGLARIAQKGGGKSVIETLPAESAPIEESTPPPAANEESPLTTPPDQK